MCNIKRSVVHQVPSDYSNVVSPCNKQNGTIHMPVTFNVWGALTSYSKLPLNTSLM